jgi:DNA-binding transcriptional LysR family regulator
MLQRATLKQLRTFESAARLLHFGRAAAELHLTQPAVSIQLQQLENEVGLPLFEQVGRRMHLTHLGEELLGHVRALLARLREAEEAMEGLRGGGGGELHIAATTTAEYFAPRLLAEFRRLRRGLKVRLTVNNRDAVVRELTDNNVDLAVMGRAPRGLNAVATAFAKHPLAIIAAPDHPLVQKRRLQLRQLAGETFLIREHGSGTRGAMEQAFAAQRFTPDETIEIGPNEAIKQAVAAGMGVGFVSLHTVGLELATKRLAVLPVAGMPVMRDWYVIHRARKRLSPAAAAFKDYLVAEGAGLIERAMG